MSLALGSRADTTFIRSGADKAVIQMIAEHKGSEYLITRQISSSGKNICRINDEVVTLGHLSMVCKKLADIHGQYDHQSLLNPEYHIKLLDLYHKDKILPAKETVKKLYENYSMLKVQLRNITLKSEKNKREQDFMQFELDELKDASLRPGEDEELEEKISLLQNSEKIYENLAGAYQMSSEDEYSVISALKKISDMETETAPYSASLKNSAKDLTSFTMILKTSALLSETAAITQSFLLRNLTHTYPHRNDKQTQKQTREIHSSASFLSGRTGKNTF